MRTFGVAGLLVLITVFCRLAGADDEDRTVSLAMRDVALAEVMAMLARTERINILLADDVEATVSFTLYDVPLFKAIQSIAEAAGYAVERRDGTYFVVDRDDVGSYAASDLTEVRTFKIQYTDPATVQSSLQPYLSEYGQITSIPERNLLMIEDMPAFLRRMDSLIGEIDRTPRQILIEAKILEITLDDEDSYGVEWSDFFTPGDGEGSAGTHGFADAGNSGTSGAFVNIANSEFSLLLTALESDGRVRTLSTPKLLSLENEESSVIVGDRRGYAVTTTINQVTTETIEFLESGVILNVTPSVDRDGRVMLDIHPEVSNGVIDVRGIPSQTTTEVTTQLLVESGQTVFIGGLIKHTQSETRKGVPVIGRVPGIGRLFSSSEKNQYQYRNDRADHATNRRRLRRQPEYRGQGTGRVGRSRVAATHRYHRRASRHRRKRRPALTRQIRRLDHIVGIPRLTAMPGLLIFASLYLQRFEDMNI